jgi:hypothetical protein
MKTNLLLLFMFSTCQLLAQPAFDAKRDFEWIMGHGYLPNDTTRNVFLNFISDTLYLSYKRQQGQNFYQTNASICDTSGSLLFYSNGCVLSDNKSQYLTGADTINLGPRWSTNCADPYNSKIRTDGYTIVNGCWILPVAKNKFKVLYADGINSSSHSSGIRMATVKKDPITGKLIGYNPDTYLYLADLNTRKPGYVRHANGRDWWHVNELYGESTFYLSFIDSSDQVYPPKQQYFPEIPDFNFHGGGQASFSPDGTTFCSIDAFAQCQVFDFDRCEGRLSNPRVIPLPLPYDSIGASTGLAISPNSRFLYLMTSLNIWQYDLNAPNIETTKVRVAQNDGWKDQWGDILGFYQSQLGPNGKIYVFPPAGRSAFSVIDQPDLKGTACNVLQHKYFFPDWGNVSQPPRFPNFRLGPEVGSPCDTLKVNSTAPAPVPQAHLSLRPNPATSHTVADITVLDYSAEMELEFIISDLSGVQLDSYRVPPYAALQRIETAYLPNGLYFVTLKSKGRVLKTEKLVVLRE